MPSTKISTQGTSSRPVDGSEGREPTERRAQRNLPADASSPAAQSASCLSIQDDRLIGALLQGLDDGSLLRLRHVSRVFLPQPEGRQRLASAVLQAPRAADREQFEGLLQQLPGAVTHAPKWGLDAWRLERISSMFTPLPRLPRLQHLALNLGHTALPEAAAARASALREIYLQSMTLVQAAGALHALELTGPIYPQSGDLVDSPAYRSCFIAEDQAQTLTEDFSRALPASLRILGVYGLLDDGERDEKDFTGAWSGLHLLRVRPPRSLEAWVIRYLTPSGADLAALGQAMPAALQRFEMSFDGLVFAREGENDGPKARQVTADQGHAFLASLPRTLQTLELNQLLVYGPTYLNAELGACMGLALSRLPLLEHITLRLYGSVEALRCVLQGVRQAPVQALTVEIDASGDTSLGQPPDWPATLKNLKAAVTWDHVAVEDPQIIVDSYAAYLTALPGSLQTLKLFLPTLDRGEPDTMPKVADALHVWLQQRNPQLRSLQITIIEWSYEMWYGTSRNYTVG